MLANLNLSMVTANLPNHIKDCYKIEVSLPAVATVINIELTKNNSKQQLNFWLLKNNNSNFILCSFYLLNKNKNNGCLKCSNQQIIQPILQFQHPQYILVGVFKAESRLIQSLKRN